MNNPLVSIIIPTYNRAHLIGETLDSVLAQTYSNWECIIIDDGSIDNTTEVVNYYLKNDARFQYHKRPNMHKLGGNGSRNYGFSVSKGEFVQWFDDDDVMLNSYLEDRVELFESETMIVIGTGFYTNSEFKERRIIPIMLENFLYKDYVLWKSQVLTPSVLFRRQYLVGGKIFSEELLRGQETELLSRLFFDLKESEYKILNKPLFLYRQHTKTKTFQNEIYRPDFKASQLIVALKNLKRSYVLKDRLLIEYCRSGIVNIFFRALQNKDCNNVKIILNQSQLLWKSQTKLRCQFVILGYIFLAFGRGSYKIEKYFKRQINKKNLLFS